MTKIVTRFQIAVLLLFLCTPGICSAATVPQLPDHLPAPSEPFLPYCSYLLDESGDMDISEAAAPQQAEKYQPLLLRNLPRETGALWLRFTLAPLKEKGPGVFLLDMGQSVPGVPVLYEPVFNPLSGIREWRESSPAQRNILLLPEAGAESLTCYIRLDGLPGIWFAPMLRTPHDAATDLAGMAHTAALLALGIVMLLCLLRGLSEQGQWRYWTAFYVAVAFLQGMSGLPASSTGHFGMSDLPAVLAPGLALMLLPHVGRHLMHTREHSRALDMQLLFLSLPGAVLALLPLIPSYTWLSRFLDLWPLATLIFIPTAMGASIRGLNGSKRFLLGCILPPLCVAGGLLGLESDCPPSLLAAAPLCGVALSALLIAATRAPHTAEPDEKPAAKAQTALKSGEAVIPLEHPLNDPSLRLIPAKPAVVRSEDEEADEAPQRTEEPSAFNLQYLMREVHDAIAPVAEKAGIGLSWYMPPYLEQMYEGPAASLSEALRLLLESAVRATAQGAVQFSVRAQSESCDSGQLLFTVRDSGTALSSQGRSMLALKRAWDVAGACAGSLDMQYDAKGVTISFTVQLRTLDHKTVQDTQDGMQADAHDSRLTVLLVAPQEKDRQEMRDMLQGLPCRCMDFATLAEGLPAVTGLTPLLVLRGAQAVPEVAPLLREIEKRNETSGAAPVRILGITADDCLWDALADAGFTHALLEPLDAADLRKTVEDALQSAAVEASTAVADSHSQTYEADLSEQPPVPDLFGSLESPPASAPQGVKKPLPDLDLSLLPNGMPCPQRTEPEVVTKLAASEQTDACPPAAAACSETVTAVPEAPVADSGAKQSTALHEQAFEEWVGEPTPIQRTAAATAESTASTASPASETLPTPGSDRTLLELVARLDAAMDEAHRAFEERHGFKVGLAAGRIAAESEAFGFRVLARMARCVERAAKANDMSALKDLLPELAVAVERNRIALNPRR